MGNKPVTVGVRTDQAQYAAGSVVTGKVYVSITGKPQPLQALLLKIVGAEEVLVHHTTTTSLPDNNGLNDRQSRTENHYERARVPFLNMEYPLQTFHGNDLPPGQYEYPFRIQLPSTLPSTMACQLGESYARVHYEIVAKFQKPSGSIFDPSPTFKQTLQIFATAPLTIDQGIHLPMEQIPVKNCCCFGKGTMALEMQTDRTLVEPQDTLTVNFRCENQSTVKVKYIRVQLLQIVEWNCNGYRENYQTMLDRRDLDANLYPELLNLNKVPRHYFGMGQRLVTNENWHTTQLQVQPQSYDSYSGRAIQVRHVLSVRLLTKGCCNSTPEASTLLQLYRSVPRPEVAEVEEDPLKAASAPPEFYDTPGPSGPMVAPSAPSEAYDLSTNATYVDATPVAEAQVLPEDWHAQTADVVDIPMAEAVILESVARFG